MPVTRDFERTTFGPFARRAIRGAAEAFFTDPDAPADLPDLAGGGADARMEWLVADADDMVSHGSAQLQTGLRIAITVLELLPIFVIGRLSLASNLSLEERVRFLRKVETGPLTFLALLVVAWKTLLTVLYFEHPEAAPLLGYDGKHERYKVALAARPEAEREPRAES
jgi:hypothetical protein